MSVRPLAPFNPNSVDNVDDALAMLDAGVAELMEMTKDQLLFGPTEFFVLDKNVLCLKGRCDRIEALILEEKKS